MPDADARTKMAHLLRRTGFGPTAAEIDAALTVGYEGTVNRLVDFSAPDPVDAIGLPAFSPYAPAGAKNLTTAERRAIESQRSKDEQALVGWWLNRMAGTAHPLREKLTWFWHGHFATSYQKVRRADYMAAQNQIFRTQGAGNFESLTQAVAKDPAMLIWLDAATNVKAHPNENFARECMELFTLGIGNYTEDDVKEAARAFTGWHIDRAAGGFAVSARAHDSGSKTVLGQTGSWGGEEVIHILVNSPISPPYIVSRLWGHFAYPVETSDPVVKDLAPAFAATHDIRALVKAMLLHPQFVSDQARSGLVKQPIEWILGLARTFALSPTDKRLVGAFAGLGQVPLQPPNVGGWPQNEYWLTTASSLVRLRIAASVANPIASGFLGATPARERPAAAAHLLSVGAWDDVTANALAQVADDPKSMLALALVAPQYVLA